VETPSSSPTPLTHTPHPHPHAQNYDNTTHMVVVVAAGVKDFFFGIQGKRQ